MQPSPPGVRVLDLGHGALYALAAPYALDGRVSSHPITARGFTTMNCYLFVEPSRALLYNTGYSVHQEAMIAALGQLVGQRTLDLMVARTEFPALCNARPIADRFAVDRVYQKNARHPALFLNFRPELKARKRDGLRTVVRLPVSAGVAVPVVDVGDRSIEVLVPEIRLLPSFWAYDRATKTLLTGDLFSWVSAPTEDGPWMLDGKSATGATEESVKEFLVRNRYWWLAGADTSEMRQALATVFESNDVSTIAPDHGAVLRGQMIAQHYQLLDDVLASVAREPAVGVEAGRWRAREEQQWSH